jgi:hypothetical protein
LSLPLAALLVALHSVPPAPWAPGGPSRPEDLVISVVTFGPGSDLPSWWGHTALVVEDRALQHGRLYNYGMFDFSTGFVHKFVQGRLEFWVGEASVRGTYDFYKELDRDVRVQILDLTPEQASQAARALATNVMPENREYLYHHYNDNCSTRPRDIIDLALGGALKRATAGKSRMSLREHTRRYSQVFPPMSLVLDYLQNDELDRPITMQEEAFLPDELERQLDQLSVDGHPVVKQKVMYWTSTSRPPVPADPPTWNVWLALISVAAGAFVVFLSRRLDTRGARIALGAFLTLEGLIWGSLGVFLFIVGIWTNHQVAHRNENLFLINPVTFALLFLGPMLMKGSPRAVPALKWVSAVLAGTALLGVVVKVLPMFDQQNWNLICLVLPLSVATGFAFWKVPAVAQSSATTPAPKNGEKRKAA